MFVCALVVYYSLKVGLVGHVGSSLSHAFIVQFGCPPSVTQHLVQYRLIPAETCSGCHLLGCSTTSDTAPGAEQAATSPDLQWLPCTCIYVHPITVSVLQPTLHLASQPSKPTSQLPAFHPTDPPASFQPFIQHIHQLASSHSSIRSTSQLPAIHPSDPPASFQPFIQQIHQLASSHSSIRSTSQLPAIHPSDPPASFQPFIQQIHQPASSHSSNRSTSQLPAIHPSDPPVSFQPFIHQIHQPASSHPINKSTNQLPACRRELEQQILSSNLIYLSLLE